MADQLRLTNKSINRLSRFSQENRDIKKDLCITFFEGRSITRTVLTQLSTKVIMETKHGIFNSEESKYEIKYCTS